MTVQQNKRRAARAAGALVLVCTLLAGTWAAALAGLRSRRCAGQPQLQLPRLEAADDGGLELTAGGRQWVLTAGRLRSGLAAVGRAEAFLPPGLRVAVLAALSGADLLRQNRPVGGRQLVDAPGARLW